MQGYSPKLPLVHDNAEDGLYGLNKTLLDTIKQNLKMLLLTNPGERMMDSNFGVGIKKYLFEQDTNSLREEMQKRIVFQVSRYLNYVKILEINISRPDDNQENFMYINIRYTVPSLNVNDELNINP